MVVLPTQANAKEGKAPNQITQIEQPQTRLSPEIKIPQKNGTNPKNWIVKHKWWMIVSASALTGGLILLNSSDDTDDNNTDKIDGGYGQISGKW